MQHLDCINVREKIKAEYSGAEHCVVCGSAIPEGRMVCAICATHSEPEDPKDKIIVELQRENARIREENVKIRQNYVSGEILKDYIAELNKYKALLLTKEEAKKLRRTDYDD